METNKDNYSHPENTRFKSYYVVWKQIEEAGVGDTPTRLNRTMQYGNDILYFSMFSLHGGFKSYYVVWKPKQRPNTK